MDRKQQRGLTFLCLDIVNPPHTANGSEIHKFEFLDNLAGKIETLIVLCRGDVPFAPRRGLRCIRLAGGNIFLTYLHFFVFLLGNAVFLDCDVLYTRGSSFGYFGSKILRLHKNTRLVVEVNGILDDEYALRGDRMRGGKRLGSLRMRMNWTIAHRMERYFLTHADTFIAVTEGIRQHLIHAGIEPGKIHVVGNGANMKKFYPVPREEAKKALQLSPDAMYIVFSGNFAPWQGLDVLVNAAPRIVSQIPQSRFLLVGDGIMKSRLQDLAKTLGVLEYIVFTGFVPYADVPRYINAGHLCVAPFITARNAKIGLSPLKIYEYMACERAVIASEIPGITELLQQSGGGVVVPPENPEALATAIIDLARAEERSRLMGVQGRRYILEHHSWDAIAGRVAAICSELCGKPQKSPDT